MTVREQIRQFCLDAGYAEFQPVGTYLRVHSCGMREGWAIRLRTERTVVDGYHAVYVYPDRVVLAAVRYPANYADWRAYDESSYDDEDQLTAALERLTKAPQASCWAAGGAA